MLQFNVLLALLLLVTCVSVSSVPFNGLNIPSECNDNPYFASCNLIVRSKFCNHHYYSMFCCKSCADAGQFNPMQKFDHIEDTDYWK